MTENTIPAVKLRNNLGEIIKKSVTKGVHYIVEKSGIPMIAVINIKEYEEYKRIMEERQKRFKIIDVIRSGVPNFPPDEIEQDISEAIEAVRKR